MKCLPPCLLLVRWLIIAQGIFFALAAKAALLNVGGLETTATNSGIIPIEFRSSGDVAALQLDVLFDAAAYTAGPASQGTLDDSFRVDSHLVEAGRLRVVVGAPGNAALGNSVVFRVPLTAAGEFTSYFPVALANIVLSSSQSASVAVQVAPSVRFTKLADGAAINGKNGIKISSDALAATGNITKVTYYAGSAKLFSSTTSPFTYKWAPSKAGSYSLKAVATDSNGQTTTKSIQVDVFFNSPPTAKPITLAVIQNRTTAIPYSTLTAPAKDPDGDKLIVSEFDDHSSQNGVLDIAGNTITYTPVANFAGKDSFTYAVSDELDGQADNKVNLLVRRALQTDLNLDKQADLVLIAENKKRSLILTLKNGALLKQVNGPDIGSGFKLAAVDDFNTDGKPDFLTIDPLTGISQFIVFDDANVVEVKTGPVIPAGYGIVAADDFNMDGATDLLLLNAKKRKTVIWYLRNFAKVSEKNGPTIPVGWNVIGTDDFNNDGKPDLCLANAKKTKAVIWYLNKQVLTEMSKEFDMSSGFQLAGVADFDRNGKPDLILFNPANRKTLVLKMDNAKVVGKTNGPAIPSGYSIAAPK